MRNFYSRNKALGLNVPHILGLTASPVMRSSTSSLGKIEQTLDAICRSPSKHRAELRLQVKLPVLCQVRYSASAAGGPLAVPTRMMISLADSYHGLRLTNDPYYLSLLKDNSYRGRRRLDKVRLSMKTPASEQMRSFTATANKIWLELGPSAADHYISEVIRRVLALAGQADNSLGTWDIPSAEKQYIANALRHIEVNNNVNLGSASVLQTTDKVEKMIDALLAAAASAIFSGIIFVQVSTLERSF
jgi:hypothetical protein